MSLLTILFFCCFFLILLSGFPVGFGLGFLAIGVSVIFTGVDMGLTHSIMKAYHALDTPILVAVPMFIFAAEIIGETGIGARLFQAARFWLGKYRAGLGIGTIMAGGLFAAMTGSSFVAAATIGLIAIPELRRAKYSDEMISTVISSGGSLGSIIPPSIAMIIYGYLTGESVSKLFMAGMIPGLLLMVLFSISVFIIGNMTGGVGSPLPEDENRTLKDKVLSLKDAFWGLMAPVVILGGIYGGFFTPSEAAAVAAVYSILIGFFMYRTLTFKKLFQVMLRTASTSGMVAMLIVGGAMLGHGMTLVQAPQKLLELVINLDLSPVVFMILINVLLFVFGMFMEVVAMIYIAVPLLYPVVVHMGWDNIWFAIIFLININLALVTPPVGGILYIISQVGTIHITKVLKGASVTIFVLVLGLVLVIIFPPIATWLPGLMG